MSSFDVILNLIQSFIYSNNKYVSSFYNKEINYVKEKKIKDFKEDLLSLLEPHVENIYLNDSEHFLYN